MALFRDDEGRTEKPTPQRLGEARDKGHTPLSRELVLAGTLLVSVLAIEHLGPWLLQSLAEVLRHGADVDLRNHALAGASVPALCAEVYRPLEHILLPFCVLVLIGLGAALLFGYGQIGLRWTPKALGFKPERMHPGKNLARLLSLGSVVRALIAFGKLVVLVGVLALVLDGGWPLLANLLDNQDLHGAFARIAALALRVLFWIAAVVLVLAIGDLAWQRFEFTRNLRMTRQEVDDERRRAEGDPLIKSRLRSARLELMRQRMMEAVPKADVVITNPTHYSVALRYDRLRHRSPEVVAKGVDELALRIRELARKHRVPLMEDPPLARALHRAVKVGQQVPAKFYRAVATVLTHVYRLRGKVA